jgi:hypothetical protein
MVTAIAVRLLLTPVPNDALVFQTTVFFRKVTAALDVGLLGCDAR